MTKLIGIGTQTLYGYPKIMDAGLIKSRFRRHAAEETFPVKNDQGAKRLILLNRDYSPLAAHTRCLRFHPCPTVGEALAAGARRLHSAWGWTRYSQVTEKGDTGLVSPRETTPDLPFIKPLIILKK